MANRYWVGGTGTWDGTALLKWSTTSGGIGGSAVPTSADTVFFDANSGANTVTIGAGTAICSTLTMTGFTGTLAFGTNSIDLAGTGAVTVYTGATTFSVTGTPLMLVTGNTASSRSILSGATTEANSISFNISAGNGFISNTAGNNIKNLTFSGTFTGTLGNSSRTIYGNLTLKSGMTLTAGTGVATFAATSGTQQITSAALNFDFPITFSGTATYQLQDALSVGTTTSRAITLTSGTLDLNNNTLTNFGTITGNGTTARAIAFGTTGAIYLTTNNVTLFNVSTATNFSITGTSAIYLSYSGATGTRTINYGTIAAPASTEANSLSIYVTAGSDIIALTSGGYWKNLVFSGTFTGSVSNTTKNIYGNLTFKTGMTLTAGTNATTFAATSGTQQITSAALTLDFPITINAPAATVQLVDALTIGATRIVTLTSGALDLNNNSLTCGFFSTSNSNTRSIAFGTGQIYVTGNSGVVWGSNTATGFTVTGTPIVNATYSGSTGTRDIASGDMGEGNSISFNITAGSDNLTGTLNCNNYNFTGFSGSLSGSKKVYGNLTIPSTVTSIGSQAGAWQFAATSGTKTITTSNKAFDQPITFSGVGGAWQLVGDLITGSTRTITLNSGTLNSNGYNINCGTFGYNTASTKALTLTNSTVTITGGTSTTGFAGSTTGTTFNLTGAEIIFTTTGTAALVGIGSTNTDLIITMSGTAGTLIIGASAQQTTIKTLRNTVQPCTISLLSTANALTVTNFNLSGTAGNLVTFNSSVAGTARTISKASGTVNAQYMYIQDSTASGGATWNAQFSTNAGNNTGWNFSTNFTGAVSEAFSILDIIDVLAAFNSDITEPITLADTPDTTAAFISDTTEPITVEDTPTGNATFIGVITEDTQIADTSSAIATFAAAIVEAATLADSQSVVLTQYSVISEDITLADSQTVVASFTNVVFENIGVADSQSVVASFAVVITEDTNLQDTQSVLASFVSSLSEAITAADSSIAVRIHNSDLTETITLADAQTALRIHNALVSENLAPADAATVIASFTSQITENLVLLDEYFPRGWFKIDDDQTASWGAVSNENTAVWVAINSSQTAIWNAVNNANSTTWVNIDDNQNPNWVVINDTQ
jgi:hypothetical protein